MSNWKHVDFHLHTLPNSELDNSFSFSMTWMDEYIDDTKLDAIAITNHDFLDLDNYKKIKQHFDNKIVVFPGAEIKLKGGHILVIDDGENAKRLSDSLRELLETKESGLLPNERDFIEAFPYYDELLIIKDAAKSKSYNPDSDHSQLEKSFAAGDAGNFKSFNRLKKIDEEVVPVLFGDHHATEDSFDDRRHYTLQKTTYINVSDLKIASIKLALQSKNNVSLDPKTVVDHPAVFHINGTTVIGSDSENLILGKRGTGKTHLIEALLSESNVETLYIRQGELVRDSTSEEFINNLRIDNQPVVEEYFSTYMPLFNELTQLRQLKDNRKFAIDFLQSIKEFGRQTSNTDTASSVPLFKSKKHAKSHKTMGLAKIQKALNDLLNVSNEKYSKTIQTIVPRESLSQLISIFNSEQVAADKQNKLDEVTEEIRSGVKTELAKISASNPPDEGNFNVLDWFGREKRIELLNFAIGDSFVKDHVIMNEKVGGFFTLRITATPFKNAQEILDQNKRRVAVAEAFDEYYRNGNYWEYLQSLLKNDEFNSVQMWQLLLKMNFELLNEEGKPASGGQRAEYELLKKLDTAHLYDLVLIDEPEASFDNPFLTNRLLPTIDRIAQKATTFIITHSSSVGSLLNPDYIFVTKLIDGQYKVLAGSFSSGEIKDIDTGITESVYDNIIDLMEAGHFKFDEKRKVYGNLEKLKQWPND